MGALLTERAAAPLLPLRLEPMLAQAAEGPLRSPEYAYEVKWDGMRVLVGVEDGTLSLRTRNGLEAAPRFPELAALPERLACSRAVLDGEIVRLVDGRPDFGALQSRIQLQTPAEIERAAAAEPAALILFDMPSDGDGWLLDRPWEERRRRLESCVTADARVQVSPVWPDGQALWQTVEALDLEGIMAKRRTSSYLPGKRSPAWLKIKRSRTVDLVVGGWTEGSGARTGLIRALVLGWYDAGRLVCVGCVGTGFDDASLEGISALLREVETRECPFHVRPETNAPAHWVRPLAVCEVRHMGWSSDGKLRFPVFLRWRPDRTPESCTALSRG